MISRDRSFAASTNNPGNQDHLEIPRDGQQKVSCFGGGFSAIIRSGSRHGTWHIKQSVSWSLALLVACKLCEARSASAAAQRGSKAHTFVVVYLKGFFWVPYKGVTGSTTIGSAAGAPSMAVGVAASACGDAATDRGGNREADARRQKDRVNAIYCTIVRLQETSISLSLLTLLGPAKYLMSMACEE